MSKKTETPDPKPEANRKTAQSGNGRVYDENTHQWIDTNDTAAAAPAPADADPKKAEE